MSGYVLHMSPDVRHYTTAFPHLTASVIADAALAGIQCSTEMSTSRWAERPWAQSTLHCDIPCNTSPPKIKCLGWLNISGVVINYRSESGDIGLCLWKRKIGIHVGGGVLAALPKPPSSKRGMGGWRGWKREKAAYRKRKKKKSADKSEQQRTSRHPL